MRPATHFRLASLALVLVAGVASAQPPVNTRWTGGTAIAPTQGNFNKGTPLTLTWGFMALGTNIDDQQFNGIPTAVNASNNLQTRLNALYTTEGGQAAWEPLFTSVFDRWAAVSGLSYRRELNDDGAAFGPSQFPGGQLGVRADIRIGGKNIDGNSGVLAYNYFPEFGEMVLDTNDDFYTNKANNSLLLRNIISHEHGHGLGMNHVESNGSGAANGGFLMEPFIQGSFDGPQHHDILAAHNQYGDAREKSNGGQGNDTRLLANSLGTIAAGSSASVGNSARTLGVLPTATDFVSIDSSTDTDFFSFSVAGNVTVRVQLDALGFTYNLTAQNQGGNVPFNTRERSNLLLELLGPDGTVIATVDANGLGGNETLTRDLLDAGTYFVRVAGADNADSILLDSQFYGLSISVVPVPEPGSVMLLASAAGACGWAARRVRFGRAA